MREVCEDSLCCEVVLEKVEELGEPVREDKDDSRSSKAVLACGLNERVVAIVPLSQSLDCRTILSIEHLRELSCPFQFDTAEPEQLRDVAVKSTLAL
jgi:hypothetical protein